MTRFQETWIFPNDLFSCVTRPLSELRIYIFDLAVNIGDEHRRRTLFDSARELDDVYTCLDECLLGADVNRSRPREPP